MNLTLAITKGNKVVIRCAMIALIISFYQIYIGVGSFIQWSIIAICVIAQIVIATKAMKAAKMDIGNTTN